MAEDGSQQASRAQAPSPHGPERTRRLAPECETVLDLIGVFTHDVSNPLQSLTVLLELAVDELSPTSEPSIKISQSLESVERLRDLVRDFSSIARGASEPPAGSDCSIAIRRMVGVLQRRFERTSMETEIELTALEGLPLPEGCVEFATLSLLLGAVGLAARSDLGSFELRLGSERGDSDGAERAVVAMALAGRITEQDPFEPQHLDAETIDRSRAMMERIGGGVTLDGARIELWWPISRSGVPGT